MDMKEFLENRKQVAPRELERYAGKYVAWSPDGKRILAANDDPLKVVAEVASAGYDPSDCVISSVPAAEEALLSGGLDE